MSNVVAMPTRRTPGTWYADEGAARRFTAFPVGWIVDHMRDRIPLVFQSVIAVTAGVGRNDNKPLLQLHVATNAERAELQKRVDLLKTFSDAMLMDESNVPVALKNVPCVVLVGAPAVH